MPNYQSESFYRAKISQSILSNTAVPFAVRLSKLPTITNGLLTISPNTENEEMVEYNNLNSANMTIDIIKRWIKPSSILLTTNAVDYNNVSFMRAHTQNDIIRGDVNHIHINQGIGNTTLATNVGVGIAKLSVAAVDAWNPIVVGDNDTRLIPVDASATVKGIAKLSVAPVSAVNPIAVGTNDPRLTPDTIATINWFTWSVSGANVHTISTSVTWLLKGNGTAMSAATEGTDFYKPAGTDVAVADGGTWVSSATAYAPIFGWTTNTWAQQSGTAWIIWQVLTSNWAWALPTFKYFPIKTHTAVQSLMNIPAAPWIGQNNGTTVTYEGGLIFWLIQWLSEGNGFNLEIRLVYSPNNSTWTTIATANATAQSSNNFSVAVWPKTVWIIVPAWYIRCEAVGTGVNAGWGSNTNWTYFQY